MVPELGHFALILALVFSLLQASLLFYGVFKNQKLAEAYLLPLTYGQFCFVFLSYALLAYSFIVNDFSILYVAQNSSTQLPWIYRLTAVWGSHEGSLLLWVFILSIWTLGIAQFSKPLDKKTMAIVIAVLGIIATGFILFILMTSNPFLRLLPQVPLEGRDLNPLLQDLGFLIHPPMLYMGYVGFSVAFSFSIAALIVGRLDAQFIHWVRPWTLFAWCFLTLGIALGSWWAYRELGWGGWWFWDPVENASLLPWLVGTALIHALANAEKRDAFKSWTVLLAILAFSLSLLGTFLVRSGVLTSVHAFANDAKRGIYILLFLFVVIGSSLSLYAWRSSSLRKEVFFSPFSRESLLLANNVILVVIMSAVLLGTLYPLFIETLGLGKISVGSPYFNAIFIPLMVPLLFLMGLGPNCQWQQMSFSLLFKRLRMSLLLSLLIGISLTYGWMRSSDLLTCVGITLALWITLSTLQSVYRQTQRTQSFYGMVIAHIGVAVCILGITFSTTYQQERHVRLSPGDLVSIGQYSFQLEKIEKLVGSNYGGFSAKFLVKKNNHRIAEMDAQKRNYHIAGMMMTDAAIQAGFFRDLYVSLGEPLDKGAWSVRVYYKPFIRWIWLGALLMMLGGILAAWGIHSRRRV
ncbi:MAG: heme lyase CcmF/NrfE family subunit [Proteobacteria bacterium]|nr:heme lyase CcmF/NrfE family subunit [Pseudomonadota bacterium]